MSVQILVGDVREKLREIPDASIDTVCSSPPYWGLRDYGVTGQIGLEPTLAEHLAVLVEVFREIRRVLKPCGTVWLNYGDCYATTPNGRAAADVQGDDRTFRDKPFSTVGTGPVFGNLFDRPFREVVNSTKPKDLCMVPNLLAIALRADGWTVRSEIIWHKPNPMPESVYDRPTVTHEKVWLLTKGEDYFYDHEAIREPVTGGAHARKPGPNSRQNVDRVPRSRKPMKVPGGWDIAPGAHGTIHREGRTEATYHARPGVTPKSAADDDPFIKAKGSFHEAIGDLVETKNSRNVWTIAPRAFSAEFCTSCESYFEGSSLRALECVEIPRGDKAIKKRICGGCGSHEHWLSHFATFPPALAERCIKAGAPKTTCGACGAIEDCGGLCSTFGRKRGLVLDPFGGAGTVGLVAEQLGLDSILIELNPQYATLASKRIAAGLSEEQTDVEEKAA